MGQQNDVGIIGLGVMGSNYALNILDKGFSLSAFDIDPNLVQKFQGSLNGKNADLFTDLKDFVTTLKRPRKIVMLIKIRQ